MIDASSIEEWEAAGYVRWRTNKLEIHKLADFGLQKAVRDTDGNICYYITCYCYDHSRYDKLPKEFRNSIGVMPMVQFRGPSIPTTNVELNHCTVEQAEKTLDAIWKILGKPMYD